MKFPFAQKINPTQAPFRFIAFDIGSLYLKFAFFEKKQTGLEVILWGQEELNVIFWKRPLERLWPIIQEAYAAAKEKDGNLPVFLNFSPSICKAKILEVRFMRTNPLGGITKKEEEQIQNEVRRTAGEKMKEELSYMLKMRKEDLVLENFQILKTTIDGYKCAKLQGLKGTSLVFRVLGAFLPLGYSERIRSIAHQYHLGEQKFLHEAQMVQSFSRANNQDGVFLDVGDKTTEIIVVKNSELLSVNDIAFGSDVFTQAIEQALGIPENIAREFKEKYTKGKLSDDVRKKTHDFFLPHAEIFVRLVRESLEKNIGALPPHIFLYGGGAFIPELLEILEGNALRKLPFFKTPTFSLLKPRDVANISNFNQIDNPLYTTLFLENYAAF